jgi:hypothetical protein
LREIAGERQIRSDVATGKLARVRRSQQNLAVVAVKRHYATLPHVRWAGKAASGQKEMLMPIAGKKAGKEAAAKKPASKPQRKSA